MAAWNPRANEVFADILELPLAQRQALLERACGPDCELRQQVEALLAAHAAAGDFLDRPAPGARHEPTTAPDSGPPLPIDGNVVQALAAASRVQLRDAEGEAPTPVAQANSDNLPRGLDPAGQLQVLGEIARGGMGAVLKGRDTRLGRDLAVKVLLETHQGKTELVQRFVEEAQIAGQLQHPGIVPVYELGQFPDKRPYFTMKLVKGQTLAALLAGRKGPAEDRPRLVGVFGQVCQTLAYAHARGVIHRDLKPSNVMVGSFGEVQVMDWGLAKVLRQGGADDEQKGQAQQTVSVIQTQRGAGPHTQAGSVMGTPAYMAPEQARGDGGLVDERGDVFGLGAILCEILTGEPPFTGPRAEAMRKAQTARLDDALRRLDGCGTDGELIGLARRCLAAEPWDRPRDAGAVVEAVTAYQNSVAERLRRAELARAAEAARAEEARATAAAERKARRRTRALAASVLALVAVAAAGGLWLQRQWAERAAEAGRQREAVEAALGRAGELRRQARWAEARAVLEQTRDRLGETGPEDLRQRVEQATADLALVDRLEDIRLKRSTLVEGKFDDRGAEEHYAEAFRKAGLGAEGDDAAAVAARIRSSAVSEQLVAALDTWATVTKYPTRRTWLMDVARRADPDPWRDRLRQGRTGGGQGDVARRADLLEALASELLADEKQLARQAPQLLARLGVLLREYQRDPVPLLTAAQARHPDDFWLNFELGDALQHAKRWDEAVGFYRAAAAVRPSASAVHNNLGIALYDKNQVDEAIHEYRRAIELDPQNAMPHHNLGLALKAKNQVDEAIQECRQAIAIDPKFANAHGALGNALYAKKDVDGAMAEFRQAIALDPKLGVAHNNLGFVLLWQGRFVEARTATRRALELLPESDPLREHASQQLQHCERLAALEAKLPALLSGQVEPANAAERADFAWYCGFKGLPTRAARLYAEAFSVDPKLANNLEQAHRYNAARVGALAGCGQAEDARALPDKEMLGLRRQALDWLKADLALNAKLAGRDDPATKQTVRQRLEHWRQDADLAPVRDPGALDKLPDNERESWRRLWADVGALLKKVGGTERPASSQTEKPARGGPHLHGPAHGPHCLTFAGVVARIARIDGEARQEDQPALQRA
jgi:serine/threonine-protein kinase